MHATLSAKIKLTADKKCRRLQGIFLATKRQTFSDLNLTYGVTSTKTFIFSVCKE
jgi:hypothetical protein